MTGACCLCGRTVNSGQISLHRFPGNSRVRSLWMDACGFNESDDVSNVWICSHHFRSQDYTHTNPVKRLHREAVPSVELLKSSATASREIFSKAVLLPSKTKTFTPEATVKINPIEALSAGPTEESVPVKSTSVSASLNVTEDIENINIVSDTDDSKSENGSTTDASVSVVTERIKPHNVFEPNRISTRKRSTLTPTVSEKTKVANPTSALSTARKIAPKNATPNTRISVASAKTNPAKVLLLDFASSSNYISLIPAPFKVANLAIPVNVGPTANESTPRNNRTNLFKSTPIKRVNPSKVLLLNLASPPTPTTSVATKQANLTNVMVKANESMTRSIPVKENSTTREHRLLAEPRYISHRPVESKAVQTSFDVTPAQYTCFCSHQQDETFPSNHEEISSRRSFVHPRYVAEIEVRDVSTPEKAKKIIEFVKSNDKKKSTQIKCLQTKIRRLNRRIASLEKTMCDLIEKGYPVPQELKEPQESQEIENIDSDSE